MSKSLATLIRLGEWTVDERRRALAALYEREDQVIGELDAMARALERERAVAAADAAGVGFAFGGFFGRHAERREALLRQRDALRHEIERARDELADAYRELKSYETAEKSRLRRERAEAERREQIGLDEIAANLHRRKGR